MALQEGFHWKPSQSLTYYNYYYADLEAGDIPADGAITLNKNQYYGGSPYVTATGGSLYNFIHYADDRNVLNVDALKDAWGIEGELDAVTTNKILSVFSNQCSGSTYWAWSRVTPALDYHWTSNIIPRPRTGALDNATYTKGIIAVGDYDVNKGRENNPIVSYADKNDPVATKTICQANGVDTMYKAYAQVQPGDGFVFWYTSNNAGHAMMAASHAFKSDGTPLTNPDEADGSCYIYIFSQVDDWRKPDKDGITYQTGTNYNGDEAWKLVDGWPTDYRVVKYTFNYLYNTNGSLPFTLEVFEDVSKFENAKLYSTTNLKDGIYYLPSALANTKIDSNYPIASVNIAVKDTSGKLVDTLHVYTRWAGAYNNYSFQFTRSDSNLTNWPAVEAKLANYYGHTLEFSATVGTGEELHVATITMVHNNLKDDMAEIPVAHSGMTGAELRQIVLRTMATQITFQWQTDSNVHYSRNDNDNDSDTVAPDKYFNDLIAGTIYGGYRYISAKGGNGAPTGNPYIWMQLLDFSTDTPTLRPEVVDQLVGDGVFDPTDWTTTTDWIGAIFNQCSGTPFWAYSRVTGALTAPYSSQFVPANGFLTVIPKPTRAYYDSDAAYNTALERWVYLTETETYMGRTDQYEVDGTKLPLDDFEDPHLGTVSHATLKELVKYCRAFGEKLMYKAYSLCQPADGALTNHDLMIYSVNTVYDENGDIDPVKSTVTFLDQANDGKPELDIEFGGIDYSCKSVGVLVGAPTTLTYTFEHLYQHAYLPYTLAVYKDPSLVEEAKIIYDAVADDPHTNMKDGAKVTVEALLKRQVDANYPVAIITAKLTGSDETVSVYTRMAAGNANNATRIGVEGYTRGYTNFANVLNGWVEANNGSVAVEITATVGSGEELHVADITLVAAQ